MPEFLFDVFLSHSSKNKLVVRDLAQRLFNDGIRVWFDEDHIMRGGGIPATVADQMKRCRVLSYERQQQSLTMIG